MQIRIWPNQNATPVGKLADAEIQFTDGPLEGLKLVGFSVWESRGGRGLNVTFPARTYTVSGERRSYALLRTISEPGAEDAVRGLILRAYERFANERPANTAPPKRELRYERDRDVELPPQPSRATGTTGRRSASPAFPRSAQRAFNNRHED